MVETAERDEVSGWRYAMTAVGCAASIGVFAVFAHRHEISHPWLKMVLAAGASLGCLAVTRRRQAWDMLVTFWAVLMGIITILLVMTGHPGSEGWWRVFFGFSTATVVCVLLTRNRIATLLTIGLVLVVGLLKAVILYSARG